MRDWHIYALNTLEHPDEIDQFVKEWIKENPANAIKYIEIHAPSDGDPTMDSGIKPGTYRYWREALAKAQAVEAPKKADVAPAEAATPAAKPRLAALSSAKSLALGTDINEYMGDKTVSALAEKYEKALRDGDVDDALVQLKALQEA